MSKYNLNEPNKRLETYDLPVKYHTTYLYIFDHAYDQGDKLGTAFAFYPRYYSSNRIEVVNKFNRDMSRTYVQVLILDSIYSYAQMKEMASDTLKSLAFFDDTSILLVRITVKIQ